MSSSTYEGQDGSGHPGFCPDAFFDPSVSWETENPNLTSCMRDTVLAAAPAAVLAVALAAQSTVRRAAGRDGGSRSFFPIPSIRQRLSPLFWTKAALNVVLVINATSELVRHSSPM